MKERLLLVGNPGVEHIGAHLNRAAQGMGIEIRFCDVTRAFQGRPGWVRFNWWIRGRRPCRSRAFSAEVLEACKECNPRWMLATGIAPVEAWALEAMGRLGIPRLNYLTDDPWNPVHRAEWFLKALPLYDRVFSTRRANLGDLRRQGCSSVSYQPFAYAPEVHFPDPPTAPEDVVRFRCDVVFVGGADRDRLPWMEALLQTGFKVGLYGSYWERYPKTRACTRGNADPPTLRKAIGGAKVALCLVRRANRDGHSMRSFEIPAMRACMLTEDTEEHRERFGSDGEAVLYFRTPAEMLEKLRWLLAHDEERKGLAQRGYHQIIQGRHTYRDRLIEMLNLSRV